MYKQLLTGSKIKIKIDPIYLLDTHFWSTVNESPVHVIPKKMLVFPFLLTSLRPSMMDNVIHKPNICLSILLAKSHSDCILLWNIDFSPSNSLLPTFFFIKYPDLFCSKICHINNIKQDVNVNAKSE